MLPNPFVERERRAGREGFVQRMLASRRHHTPQVECVTRATRPWAFEPLACRIQRKVGVCSAPGGRSRRVRTPRGSAPAMTGKHCLLPSVS